METKEIEARFLEVNKASLLQKLSEIGAKDLGESVLEEIIFYDAAMKWRDEQKYIRLKKVGFQESYNNLT